jgi:hypothetical protein
MAQDVQPLRLNGHDAIFDAVVHHLDEVPGAGGATMQVAFLSRAADFFASRRAVDGTASRRQGFEARLSYMCAERFAGGLR